MSSGILRPGEQPVEAFGMRFAVQGPGPFIARSASDNDATWPVWYVAGPDGRRNVMRSLDYPGSTLTVREVAEEIAAACA